MKQLFTTLTLFILSVMLISLQAQPKFAGKVQKGIFSINTYGKDGNLLHQGTGFYVGQNGEAVADYSVFKGAYKATVIDAAGKQSDVDCILGADDTYSLVRFRVNTKGNVVLTAVSAPASKGSSVYALGYSNSGTGQSDQATLADTSMIDGKYAYYSLSKKLDDKLIGAPVFNEAGSLVGILKAPMGEKSYALDIRFKEVLKMEAIATRSANVALSNIFIPKGLPDSAEESLVYLYFKSRNTSNEEYMDMLNRFISSYPQNPEGYYRRATPLIDLQRFDDAEADLQKYLSLNTDKAKANYSVASTILNKLTLQPEPAYDKWTYDVALDYVDKAISLNQSDTKEEAEKKSNDVEYKILKAQILRGKGDYNGAIAIYEELNQGETKSPSFFYAISIAKEGRGDSIGACIEPIDSALAMFPDPLPAGAAEFVIRRGKLYANNGKYREAVADYNKYCYLLENKVNDVFFYEKSQIETNARMFQQAIDDINKAIELAPRSAVYRVEKGALTVRVGLYDDCIEACQAAIALNPNIIDSYRILGYAQLQKGDKVNARINLQKAIDMGDENAKTIMEKYMK